MGKKQPWRQKSFGWCSLGGGCESYGNVHSAGISRGKEEGFWCRLCPDVQLQCGEYLASHSTVCTFIVWKLNSLGFFLGKQLLCYSWTSTSSLWKSPGTSASILVIQLLALLLEQCICLILQLRKNTKHNKNLQNTLIQWILKFWRQRSWVPPYPVTSLKYFVTEDV